MVPFKKKKSLLHHVLYTIQMYQQTFLLLHHFLDELSKGFAYHNTIKNSLIESHSIYVRNLFDFFRPKSSTSKDLIYTKIMKSWDTRFDISNEREKQKKYLNRNNLHLSTFRVDNDYIAKSKVTFLTYLCYSSSNNKGFIGFAEIINMFLNQLQKKENLADLIIEELYDFENEDLLKAVLIDNDTIRELKKYYNINLGKDEEINVEVLKKPKIVFKVLD